MLSCCSLKLKKNRTDDKYLSEACAAAALFKWLQRIEGEEEESDSESIGVWQKWKKKGKRKEKGKKDVR